MTKKKLIPLLTILSIVVILVVTKQGTYSVEQQTAQLEPVAQEDESPSIDGLKPIREVSKRPGRYPSSLHYTNVRSLDWELRLEQNLKYQAGAGLKDIQIKRVESMVWVQDKNALLCESVIVTLRNQKDEESSFRALVDSQTGKVLESWDRTISDPADPRNDFKFKIDPSYQ